MKALGAVWVTAALLATGCTPRGDIFHSWDLAQGSSVTIDAQQRAITNVAVRPNQNGTVARERVVCAEPSPDAAVAVARSFAVNSNVNVDTIKTDVGGAFGLSQTLAENLAQLGERTATIQLLRDTLYRACEGYSNGALDETSYAFIIARIDTLMSTLTLGEMSAGAFGRQLAALSSVAGAGGPTDQAMKLVKDAQDLQDAADTKVKAKAKELEADKENAKLKEELAALQKDKAKADERLQLVKAMATGVLSAGGTATAGGGITGRPTTPPDLAAMQLAYFNHVRGDQGPMIAACMVTLGRRDTGAMPASTVRPQQVVAGTMTPTPLLADGRPAGQTSAPIGQASAIVDFCALFLKDIADQTFRNADARRKRMDAAVGSFPDYARTCLKAKLTPQQQARCDAFDASLRLAFQ